MKSELWVRISRMRLRPVYNAALSSRKLGLVTCPKARPGTALTAYNRCYWP